MKVGRESREMKFKTFGTKPQGFFCLQVSVKWFLCRRTMGTEDGGCDLQRKKLNFKTVLTLFQNVCLMWFLLLLVLLFVSILAFPS